MTQHNRPNVDGFIVRRRTASAGSTKPRPTLDGALHGVPDQFLIDPTSRPVVADKNDPSLRRPDGAMPVNDEGAIALPAPHRERINLDLTLDDEHQKQARKKARFRLPSKRVLKWILIAFGVVVLGAGGFFAYKFLEAGGKIFKGNVITAIFNQAKPLQADTNGRSNVLLFGTSEDDPGHAGSELTDSMMLASVHQTKKDAFLVSIPRDLYIDYGRACPAGYKGKINAYYICIKEDEGEAAAQAALAKKVGEIFGLEVQYTAHVNYTALRQAVDAVGGITVTIASSDSRGILDRNFDWDCPKGLFTCYNVKYPNGPVQLNGKQALYLARARGANGLTYGLEQASFNRDEYQRKILIALKDKAVSAGTLANPVAVNNLLEALGNNVRTSFNAEEIKTLVQLGQDIKTENISTMSLNDPESPLVTTGSVGTESIVQPIKGLYNYTDIQTVVLAYATGDTAALEKAKVDVLNASGTPGLAQAKAEELGAQNIKIAIVGNAPLEIGTQPILLYDLSEGKKPGTRKKLEGLLGVTAATTLPAGVASNSDFVVIIGPKPEADAQ